MRLGISATLAHESPDEWAAKHRGLGLGAVMFPLDFKAPDARIDAYVRACRDHDLVIAEVGAWCNPMAADPAERKKNVEFCKKQLELAEFIRANCCVNITGAAGPQWDGGYVENYRPEFRSRVIETVRDIIDAVRPEYTRYTLEPMPWMIPDSPEDYLELLREIDRPGMAVHLDIVNMINSPEKYFFNSEFIVSCFQLLGPHIRSCHLKDIRLEPQLTLHLQETGCGRGGLDIACYLREAERCSPDLPVLIEHLHSEEEYLAALHRVQALL